jgi:hypothetical protein
MIIFVLEDRIPIEKPREQEVVLPTIVNRACRSVC